MKKVESKAWRVVVAPCRTYGDQTKFASFHARHKRPRSDGVGSSEFDRWEELDVMFALCFQLPCPPATIEHSSNA